MSQLPKSLSGAIELDRSRKLLQYHQRKTRRTELEVEGTARGARIDLDEPLEFAEGTRVRITVVPAKMSGPGSPASVLRLVGTLSADEAEQLLKVAESSRTIDPSLWS